MKIKKTNSVPWISKDEYNSFGGFQEYENTEDWEEFSILEKRTRETINGIVPLLHKFNNGTVAKEYSDGNITISTGEEVAPSEELTITNVTPEGVITPNKAPLYTNLGKGAIKSFTTAAGRNLIFQIYYETGYIMLNVYEVLNDGSINLLRSVSYTYTMNEEETNINSWGAVISKIFETATNVLTFIVTLPLGFNAWYSRNCFIVSLDINSGVIKQQQIIAEAPLELIEYEDDDFKGFFALGTQSANSRLFFQTVKIGDDGFFSDIGEQTALKAPDVENAIFYHYEKMGDYYYGFLSTYSTETFPESFENLTITGSKIIRFNFKFTSSEKEIEIYSTKELDNTYNFLPYENSSFVFLENETFYLQMKISNQYGVVFFDDTESLETQVSLYSDINIYSEPINSDFAILDGEIISKGLYFFKDGMINYDYNFGVAYADNEKNFTFVLNEDEENLQIVYFTNEDVTNSTVILEYYSIEIESIISQDDESPTTEYLNVDGILTSNPNWTIDGELQTDESFYLTEFQQNELKKAQIAFIEAQLQGWKPHFEMNRSVSTSAGGGISNSLGTFSYSDEIDQLPKQTLLHLRKMNLTKYYNFLKKKRALLKKVVI